MLIRWQTNEGQVVYLAASHVTAAYVTQREEGEEYIVCTELGIENVYLLGSYQEKDKAIGVLEVFTKEVNKALRLIYT